MGKITDIKFDIAELQVELAARLALIDDLEAGIASLQSELVACRAAGKAKRDRRIDKIHASAKQYRQAHPEHRAECRARAAAKLRAMSPQAREEHRERVAAYNRAYQRQRRARLAADSCQAASV
jgi:hypothetical protein